MNYNYEKGEQMKSKKCYLYILSLSIISSSLLYGCGKSQQQDDTIKSVSTVEEDDEFKIKKIGSYGETNPEKEKENDSYDDFPQISKEEMKTRPIAYDFQNGCFELNWNKNLYEFGDEFYCIFYRKNKDNTGDLFIEKVKAEENWIPEQTGYYQIHIGEYDLEKYEKAFSEFPEEYVYKEGDMTLYILEPKEVSYKEKDQEFSYYYKKFKGFETWMGINLTNIEFPKSKNYTNGYETSILKRKRYVKGLKKRGINIKDKFFKKFNYNEIIYFPSYNQDEPGIIFMVTNKNEFTMVDEQYKPIIEGEWGKEHPVVKTQKQIEIEYSDDYDISSLYNNRKEE